MSFKKILAAIDRSPLASVVFEQALESAKKEGASLIVFHCLNSDSLRQVSFRRDAEMETERVQEWLQPYCQQAKDQGIPADCTSRVGQPGPSICGFAESWEADLIILSRSNQPGLAKVLLGSVSSHVVQNAPCSVLVVQG